MLGKPIVENESIVVATLLNCFSLAKLAGSKVDERGPECINEALLGWYVSKSSHSATETGTKEISLGYCTIYHAKREWYTQSLKHPINSCPIHLLSGWLDTAGEAPRIDLAQWRDMGQVYMYWYEAVLSIKNRKQMIHWESFVQLNIKIFKRQHCFYFSIQNLEVQLIKLEIFFWFWYTSYNLNSGYSFRIYVNC